MLPTFRNSALRIPHWTKFRIILRTSEIDANPRHDERQRMSVLLVRDFADAKSSNEGVARYTKSALEQHQRHRPPCYTTYDLHPFESACSGAQANAPRERGRERTPCT